MTGGKSYDLGHSFIAMGKGFQQLKVFMNESYISDLLEVLFTQLLSTNCSVCQSNTL